MMKTATHRFFKGDTTFQYHGPLDTERPNKIKAKVYTYEQTGKGSLYDVLVFETGLKAYRVNCGPIQSTIDAIKPLHYEIERHFDI